MIRIEGYIAGSLDAQNAKKLEGASKPQENEQAMNSLKGKEFKQLEEQKKVLSDALGKAVEKLDPDEVIQELNSLNPEQKKAIEAQLGAPLADVPKIMEQVKNADRDLIADAVNKGDMGTVAHALSSRLGEAGGILANILKDLSEKLSQGKISEEKYHDFQGRVASTEGVVQGLARDISSVEQKNYAA